MSVIIPSAEPFAAPTCRDSGAIHPLVTATLAGIGALGLLSCAFLGDRGPAVLMSVGAAGVALVLAAIFAFMRDHAAVAEAATQQRVARIIQGEVLDPEYADPAAELVEPAETDEVWQ